jgi:hypothetical protein
MPRGKKTTQKKGKLIIESSSSSSSERKKSKKVGKKTMTKKKKLLIIDSSSTPSLKEKIEIFNPEKNEGINKIDLKISQDNTQMSQLPTGRLNVKINDRNESQI